MDDLAYAYWVVIFIFIFLIFVGSVAIILGVIQSLKQRKTKKTTLGSSIKVVLLAYLILAAIFYFIPEWGKVFSFFILPILSVVTLISLEVIKLFKREV